MRAGGLCCVQQCAASRTKKSGERAELREALGEPSGSLAPLGLCPSVCGPAVRAGAAVVAVCSLLLASLIGVPDCGPMPSCTGHQDETAIARSADLVTSPFGLVTLVTTLSPTYRGGHRGGNPPVASPAAQAVGYSECRNVKLHTQGVSRRASMSQHTHTTVEGAIFVVGDDEECYFGCIGVPDGEPAEATEARWNRFARTMWSFGVEPVEDEPTYSVREDKVVYDHYILKLIRPLRDHGATIGKVATALVAASVLASTFADRTQMLVGALTSIPT